LQFPEDIDREGETARPAGLESVAGPRTRSRVVVWSILFHGIAIAALWGVLTGEPLEVKDDGPPAIAIDLVALAQSAAPAPAGAPPTPQPSAPQPPAPQRVEQPVTPAQPVVRQQQPRAPRAEPRPEPAPAPAPSPTPTPAATADVTPQQPVAQHSVNANANAAGSGAGQPGASASATTKASYARLVLTRLQRAIVYPRRAQRREIEGIVRVEIVLAASGALRSVRLVATSGSDILDEAAISLVRRVAPFPAVPRDLSPNGQDIAFLAPIQYRLN